MSDKVFVLLDPVYISCYHFFPSPEAAVQWAQSKRPNYPQFVLVGPRGEMYLSDDPNELVNPVYITELTQP